MCGFQRSLWWCANCSSDFCRKDVLNEWKILCKLPKMKTKLAKAEKIIAKRQQRKTTKSQEPRMILMADATFSFSLVNFAQQKHVCARRKVKQGNPTQHCNRSILHQNFHENGKRSWSLAAIRLRWLLTIGIRLHFLFCKHIKYREILRC